MKKLVLALIVAGSFALVSCGNDKKDTVEATEAKDAATSSEGAEVYTAAPESSVSWHGFKILEATKEESGHYGAVKLKSGEVSVKDGKVESGKFVIDMNSFESVDLDETPEDKAKLDEHLKSGDFLDVTKYPEASFEISSVKPLTEGDYNSEITGNLKFRDVAKSVTFPANIKVENGVATIKSNEFKINRKDFGITFVGGKGSLIKDEVILQADITAKAK